jgi:hypothetical protein
MSTKYENTKLGMVPRALALAFSLVLTGVVAFGFATGTDHIPTRHGTVTIEVLEN